MEVLMEIEKLRDKGTRMKQFCVGMVVACLVLLATQALAQISSVEGPVPTGPDSSIFIAADVPGARLSIPLTSYGYVEEEYFVKGTAAAYGHSPSGPKVLRGNSSCNQTCQHFAKFKSATTGRGSSLPDYLDKHQIEGAKR
jgi:hypothetical protein